MVLSGGNMNLSLELTNEQSIRLNELAGELGVDPLDLARAAINDLLTKPDDDFDRAAQYVLKKNSELYRRLS
tara:strand:+ start:754 stop:969 length:216 start_codon:yes stop_codon:yes gene_type:complete